jgi:SnoaL-like domain
VLNVSDGDLRLWQYFSLLEAEYWHDVDANGGRRAHEFFTPAGSYAIGKRVFQGHEEIQQFYGWRSGRGARVSLHLVTNFRISGVTAETASFGCIMSLYAEDGEPVLESKPAIMIADVSNEYVRTETGWLLNAKILRPLFEGGVEATIPK